jgi:hypothetical protein
MTKTYGQPVYDLAKSWMEDSRDAFPANDFDALVEQLAEDLQGVLEDFTNPDYIDITMKYLRQRQEARGLKRFAG